MLKRQLKRSSKYNEDGAMPVLLGKDLEKNLDAVDTKMEETKSKWSVCKDKEKDYYYICSETDVYTEDDGEPVHFDTYEEAEDFLKQLTADEELLTEDEDTEEVEEPSEEVPAEEITEEPIEDEEIPTALDTDMEEPEEEFKDINEKVVVYLYRGFAELGDAVRVFVEDEDNEERDPELVKTLGEFMEGYPEVMDVIKEMAKTYVTSVELFDPEEEKEVIEDPVEDEEIPADEVEDNSELSLEDDIEDAEIVEAYIRENNLEYNLFESEYEIYASYSSEEQASKYEKDFNKFKGTEVFRHEDIGEVHAFVRVK